MSDTKVRFHYTHFLLFRQSQKKTPQIYLPFQKREIQQDAALDFTAAL